MVKQSFLEDSWSTSVQESLVKGIFLGVLWVHQNFSIHKNLTFWAFTKDRKQENIFISSPVGEESKLIQNEEPNPQDTLDETVETFASPSDQGNLLFYK